MRPTLSMTPTAAERHVLTFKEKLSDFQYRIYTFLFAYSRHFLAYARRGFKRRTIVCYPQAPQFFHIAFVIFHYLGLRISNDPTEPHDLAIYFQDATYGEPDSNFALLEKTGPIINRNCLDISKEHVEKVFQKVFGYSMAIDPETATGSYVRKSNQNTTHDGVIMTASSKREPGYIYQILVDNIEGEYGVDLRVPVMKGVIPCIWKKYKRATDRFDNMQFAHIAEISEEFSADEIAKIHEFSLAFGIEYGEIDVIRDKNTGKMYIVDVNNTPSSIHPISHIPERDYVTTIKRMAGLFEKTFIEKK